MCNSSSSSDICHPCLGKANPSVLHKTKTLQKHAIRTIHRAQYNSHTEPLFKNSGILRVRDLYESEVTLFMHDYTHHKLPSSFDNTFKHNYEIQESHQTRQSNLLFIERSKSVFASQLPYYTFPIMWNKWITKIPECTSQNNLKNLFNKHSLIVSCMVWCSELSNSTMHLHNVLYGTWVVSYLINANTSWGKREGEHAHV